MVVNTAVHRTSKIIGFKAFYERDEDILDWWENMPMGERSHVLRSLIRSYLSGEVVVTPSGEEAVNFSNSVQLARVQADTTRIRDAIMEIPEYLEQLVSTKLRVVQATPAAHEAGEVSTSAGATSEDEAARRAARTKKASW